MSLVAKTAKKRVGRSLKVIPGGGLNEEALKYQILFEQASDAIMTVTPDGFVDEVNRAFADLTGYLKEEVQGKALQILVPNPKVDRVPERARVLNAEILMNSGTFEDVAVLQKDGFVRLFDLTVRGVETKKSKLSLIILRDVTEKKRMERDLITKHGELKNAYVELEKAHMQLKSMQESLVQAGKLAALGEMAAGVAHELNQPLQCIRGYAQELVDTTGTTSAPNMEYLKEIVSSSDKMSSIINHLRTFTRQSVKEVKDVQVEEIIDDAFKMLSRQLEIRGIVVQKEYGKNVPKVYANPLQLEQVFINLITNARDAIEAAGKKSGRIRVRTKGEKDFIEVHFEDDGSGMDQRARKKAFNPFFTTKEVGRGMGLGLSISYGILDRLHGSIVVESEIGRGTHFKIRLPIDFRELD